MVWLVRCVFCGCVDLFMKGSVFFCFGCEREFFRCGDGVFLPVGWVKREFWFNPEFKVVCESVDDVLRFSKKND